MRILFPSLPFFPDEPDPAFADEIAAAEASGFAWSLYALEEVRTAPPRLRRCPPADGEPMLHRGWMMSGSSYHMLAEAVAARGYRLVVEPAAYAQAHYLPLAYPLLEGHTPRTVWNESESVDAAWELYGPVSGEAAILKDWVKSAKNRWREACFVPAQTDRARFGEIFAAFRAERSKLFERGVVLRRFHDLLQRGTDMRGMPIHVEHRLFFWRGALLVTTADDGALAHHERWTRLAASFASPFLTLDVALGTDGQWIVVESGDGGVSGLPVHLPAPALYQALAARGAPSGEG